MRLTDTDALPFPVFVADAGGIVRRTNEAFDRLLPDARGRAWREVLQSAREAARAVAACPRPEGPDDTRVTILADGGGETRCFDVLCQPLRPDGPDTAASGEPDRLLGVLLDITEQTRQWAENEAILQTAADAIILMDEDGRIEVFNDAASRLFGYSSEEIRGESVCRLMPEPFRSSHQGYVQRYLETGEQRIIGIGRELVAEARNGRRIPIHLAVSEIRHMGRRRFTGIIRDLSEQYAAREALAEQREKLAHVGRLSTMGEMTASIAHEINQPLTAIAMYAQSSLKLLQRPEPDLGRLAAALDKLNTQALRAGAIIERIQRFTRAQDVRREPVVINELLQDLLKLADGDARIHDVSVTLDLEQDLPRVEVDPVQIQQVALNLIRNAIDAMKDVGCRYGNALRISSRRRGDELLEVAVSDQGPGVPDDQVGLLFRPFHTTKEDGMGMGLSICRTIITEHGGELGFRNDPTGGATFFFTLPATLPAATAGDTDADHREDD